MSAGQYIKQAASLHLQRQEHNAVAILVDEGHWSVTEARAKQYRYSVDC
jgi:hypothetical protein